MTKSPIHTRHPEYTEKLPDYQKWRLAYEGGRDFIDAYLVKLSTKETVEDFNDRKLLAYCPAFSSSAIDDIKNSIYSRTPDITRVGGPTSYQKAVKLNVDRSGSSMNTFVGTEVLPEMLVESKVGVLVDMPRDLGITLKDKGEKHPFLTLYQAENILNWNYKTFDSKQVLTAVMLQETTTTADDWGLPATFGVQYRVMTLMANGVRVQFFDHDETLIKTVMLDGLTKIPFTIFQIPLSLMRNVADYQIALLNLESSDISFARKANFSIYYEFYEQRDEAAQQKQANAKGQTVNKSADREVQVGLSKGRRFPAGVERPGFVNPDPGVLEISMKKGDQLKDDIRLIVNLNLANVNARGSSADSKEIDKEGLEASLSYIGLLLEKGETELGEHWAAFEGDGKQPEIVYPRTFNMKSEKERREEAMDLDIIKDKVASNTFKRAIAKKIIRISVGADVADAELKKMYKEIEEAKTLTSDAKQILEDHEAGLVSDKTAAVARGYEESEVEQAKKDRAERIKLTMEAQGGPQGDGAARGAPEFGGKTGEDEKVGKPGRGENK